MWKMGFDDNFISWTVVLYTGTASIVTINGEISPAFNLDRAVRQGCPLAPYLYLLVANVFGYMMQVTKYEIQGLRLPNGKVSIKMLFADDTALSLAGTKAL